MIRTEAQLTVSRFCELIGMSRRTYYARRERHLLGSPSKGPWPTPVLDAIEPEVVRIAEAEPDWSHRKVWSVLLDGGRRRASPSSVRRALERRSTGEDHPEGGSSSRS